MKTKELLQGICRYFNHVGDGNINLTYIEQPIEEDNEDRLRVAIMVEREGKKLGLIYRSGTTANNNRSKESVYEELRKELIRDLTVYGVDAQIENLENIIAGNL